MRFVEGFGLGEQRGCVCIIAQTQKHNIDSWELIFLVVRADDQRFSNGLFIFGCRPLGCVEMNNHGQHLRHGFWQRHRIESIEPSFFYHTIVAVNVFVRDIAFIPHDQRDTRPIDALRLTLCDELIQSFGGRTATQGNTTCTTGRDALGYGFNQPLGRRDGNLFGVGLNYRLMVHGLFFKCFLKWA